MNGSILKRSSSFVADRQGWNDLRSHHEFNKSELTIICTFFPIESSSIVGRLVDRALSSTRDRPLQSLAPSLSAQERARPLVIDVDAKAALLKSILPNYVRRKVHFCHRFLPPRRRHQCFVQQLPKSSFPLKCIGKSLVS